MSAPPTSVTVDQEPLKVPHEPAERVAESRSTTCGRASRPEPASLPKSSVSGTDAVVYQGPPESAAVWPVGAVVSFVTVKVSVEVSPAPFVTVTVCAPEAVVFVPGVGAGVRASLSSPPPVMPETLGKLSLLMPDWPSVEVPVTVKRAVFEPCAL